MVSHAMEDYVAAIWRLTLRGGPATTSAVARKLGVTAASASYMFKKMAESGLVEYKEYAGVSLTRQGEQAAARYIRRHRLTELFLVRVLGIAWDQVDALTDQMEHALPEVVIERINAVLGHPQTCPHGYPVPDAEGNLPEIPVKPVADVEPGGAGVVARVAEHDPQLLAYLARLRLTPGQSVRMIARDRVGETFTLEIGGEQHVIGDSVAQSVFVHA